MRADCSSFAQPFGLAIDVRRLFVADSGGNRVLRFTLTRP
jgi:hypothetical protein